MRLDFCCNHSIEFLIEDSKGSINVFLGFEEFCGFYRFFIKIVLGIIFD